MSIRHPVAHKYSFLITLLCVLTFLVYAYLGIVWSVERKSEYAYRIPASLFTSDRNTESGGIPSEWIDFTSCGEDSQLVVEKQKLPLGMIHSCDEQNEVINSSRVSLVTIQYGEALNCENGCRYRKFVGVVDLKKRVFELPSATRESIVESVGELNVFTKMADKSRFKCPPLNTGTRISLGYQKNAYGYLVEFVRPFQCSWEEWDVENDRVKGYVLTVKGSVWVYRQNGKDRFDVSKLTAK